ncbi:septation protein SepH [Microbacterium sp. NPDC096154]|uniref:septation protein SepH n=1 Tax=Microbacterium sp. NPDC096154 TaxID=3155549 RepID=UPI003324D38A
MESLTIIGTEDGRLVLATEAGQRFTLAIDDVMRSEIRKAQRDQSPVEARAPLPSPREIQSHIRSGMSAEDVAELLGARVEDIRRFEGPVIAEREHIVGQALAVPVLMGVELEHDENPTFGVAIRAKLAELGATGERWTSWKESSGWIVKLEFSANDVDHDARWSFEPRRSALSPLNGDATQLSRQGPMPEGLIPRLRALDTVAPTEAADGEDSRFDSGAFGPRRLVERDARVDSDATPAPETEAPPSAVRERAAKRAPGGQAPSSDTADLLEALRRRRGQREPAPALEPEAAPEHSLRDRSGRERPAPVALFDAALHAPEQAEDQRTPAPEQDEARRRRGRPSMPSWDEIVFGARSDD